MRCFCALVERAKRVVIEIVGRAVAIRAFVRGLDAMMQGGRVTLEKVQVHRNASALCGHFGHWFLKSGASQISDLPI